MGKTLTVTARIDTMKTAPDALVTEHGSKLPLWAVSDEDLRSLASHLGDAMVAKAAQQRAAANPPPPPADTDHVRN